MGISSLSAGAVWVLNPAVALAEATNEEVAKARNLAVGVQLDLFPTVISAVNGKVGYAPQLWLGIDHVRLRVIAAHLEPPDGLAFADDEGFNSPTTTAVAFTIDYTFGDHFDGFWVGAGFEIWDRTIEHADFPTRADWSSAVATLGGGYIWRLSGNFFLDPWVGVHKTLNPATVMVGPYTYEPPTIVATASLKVGVFVGL